MGTIESIIHPPGDYYTPEKGYQPATVLIIRLEPELAASHTRYIRVLFLGMYSTADYGNPADKVSVTIPDFTPLEGEILFSKAVVYEVRK